MCGRYTLSSPNAAIADLFEMPDLPEILPRYNLAPTQESAVVRIVAPGGPRRLDRLRWGLVPYWAADLSIGNRLINARSESVAEKPAFRRSFRRQRCLVPTDGFYEWKRAGKLKQPYHIRRKDHLPFAFAGLWERWKNPEGSLVDTFTILTTDANDLLRPLHDRMPVILDRKDFALWLDPQVNDPERLQPLLLPAPGEALETVPVTRSMNSPAYDAADCIAPLVEI
jgi:putative SOS response-associated peptidase YedK